MKKLRFICMLFAIIMIAEYGFLLPASAADIHTEDLPLSDIPHVYWIKSGTAEWNALTPLERSAATFVSAEEAASMTTRALVQTVLEYPFLSDMFAYPMERGVEVVAGWFPPLAELLQREDAVDRLQAHFIVAASVESEADSIETLQAAHLLEFFRLAEETGSDMIAVQANEEPVTVLTPNGTDVVVEIVEDFEQHHTTEAKAKAEVKDMMNDYPSMTELAPVSCVYNCHSYAWYRQSYSNQYWMNDPSAYMEDGSYEEVTRTENAKVTYTNLGYLDHSGIVYDAGTSLSTTVVVGKWAWYGVYRHDLAECPYFGKHGVQTATTVIDFWG